MKVRWARTLLAWLLAMVAPGAAAFSFLFGIPTVGELGGLAFVFLLFASVALVVCLVAHPFLVRVNRTRLRDYLLAYLITIQPLLVKAYAIASSAPFRFTATAALLLSPAVILFWWLYYRLLPGAGDVITQGTEEPEYPAESKRLVVRLCVSLASTAGIVMVLATLLRIIVVSFFEPGPLPEVVRSTGLLAFIVVGWGAITHFVLAVSGRTRLWHYALSFATFSILFEALDLAPIAVFLFLGGTPAGDFLSDVLWALFYSVTLFYSLVIASGPLIWWMFYRVFSGIRC